MTDKFKEEIAGRFYTVEDLLDPPSGNPVDPAVSREVSRDRPIRLWLMTDFLLGILFDQLYVLQTCQPDATSADRRQWERLIQQVLLWVRHLERTEPHSVHVVMYPGSGSDFRDDSTAAIRA